MTDDRITGYSTENVAPLTPPDLELLGSLARQLTHAWPCGDHDDPIACVAAAEETALSEVTRSTGWALAQYTSDRARRSPVPQAPETPDEMLVEPPTELTCPIRDCPGHEGPHGSLLSETWTAADDQLWQATSTRNGTITL